jgi:hypothetical protein
MGLIIRMGETQMKAVHVAFFLSMPSCPSWNGQWSGEGRKYVIVKRFTTAKGGQLAQKMIAEGSYWYSWSDGWGACVEVKEVDGRTAGKLTRQSDGFAGYSWMVESIMSYGKIMAAHEVKAFLAKQKETAVTA